MGRLDDDPDPPGEDGDTAPLMSSSTFISMTSSSSSEQPAHSKKWTALRSSSSIPISRPPTQPRDSAYAAGFFTHFAVTVLISLFEGGPREAEDALLMSSYDAGSWASVLMIICLLSGVSGVLIAIGLTDQAVRAHLLSSAVLVANIVIQICIGNILLLFSEKYSYVGVYFLFCALNDGLKYKVHLSRLSFVGNLIDIVVEVFQAYKSSLLLVVIAIVLAQTMTLLWWGAFFVSLVSATGPLTSTGVVILMTFSWLWITQFFQGVCSYVIGGCILWYFESRRLLEEGRDDDNDSSNLNPGGSRVYLYFRCALTSSLGSICKGALYVGGSSRTLSLYSQLQARARNLVGTGGTSVRGCINGILMAMTTPFVDFARAHNRLGYCTAATYGSTFTKSSSDQYALYPESIDVLMVGEEMQSISALSSVVAGTMCILFGLFTRNEGSSRSLFLILCYAMAYSGVTLALQVYTSAVDALMVAFTNDETVVPESCIPIQRWTRKVHEERRDSQQHSV
jgi:hypothetical protein